MRSLILILMIPRLFISRLKIYISFSPRQPAMDLGALKDMLAAAPAAGRRCARSVEEEAWASAAQHSGRIAAAVAGAEDWHEARGGALAAAPVAKVLLRVRHSPAVAVRATPHTDAELLRYARTGTVLCCDARQGVWARLAMEAQGAAGAAWVLMLHPEYGPLVELLKGDVAQLPMLAPELPSPEAAAAAEPCSCALKPLRRRVRVKFSPHVLLRAAPSLKAQCVGYRRAGVTLAVDGEQGDWLRLAKEELQADDKQAWILSRHPTLGALLETECV